MKKFILLILMLFIACNVSAETADLCTGGTPTASSDTGGDYVPASAFDNDSSSHWYSNAADTQWIQYDLGAGNEAAVDKLRIMINYEPPRCPNEFTFLASNTGVFSGEEVLLYTASGGFTYDMNVYKDFTFSNDTDYRYYRINMTGKDGSFGVGVEYEITEIEMIADSSSNILAAFDLCTGGTVTQSAYVSDRSGSRAFDNANTAYSADAWNFTSPYPGWVQYDFGVGKEKRIDSYKIHAAADGASWAPKAWQFQGSNDAGSWTTLHSMSNVTGWTNGEEKSYSFTNSQSYRYYRFYITDGNIAGEAIIGEIEMFSSDYNSTTNDEYTVLLLHSDTSNSSAIFVDSSVSGNGGIGHNITGAGDVVHSTDKAKFGSTSIKFDGSGNDFLSVAQNSDFDFGKNDFTIDFWLNLNYVEHINRLVWIDPQSTDRWGEFGWDIRDDNFYICLGDTNNSSIMYSYAADTWYHLALVRKSGLVSLYINGQIAGSFTNTNSVDEGMLRIGTFDDDNQTDYYLDGYIDEFRVSLGVARWSSNFTPPTAPYAEADDEPAGGAGSNTVGIASGKRFGISSGQRFELRQ